MKKKFVLLLALIACVVQLFAEVNKYGDKAYLTFSIRGENVSKWVKCSEIYEYDQKGNETLEVNSGGTRTYEYNSHGDVIVLTGSMFSKPIYTSYQYDYNGRKIFEESSNDNRTYFYYDNKGNLINKRKELDAIPGIMEASTNDIYYEYDSQGHCTHIMYVDKKGEVYVEEWYEFDKNGNVIHEKHTYNITSTRTTENWYEYDNAGNAIYKKQKETGGSYPNNYERWLKYDKHGNEIYEKYDTGGESSYHYEYDKYGNILYKEEIYKYSDDNGRTYKEGYTYEYYTYEYYKNGSIKRKVRYLEL